MSLRKKNSAHRPSQSDQQFVKRADGTKVKNTAFTPTNKRLSPSAPNKSLDLKSDFEEEFSHPLLKYAPPERKISADFCHEISQYALDAIKHDDAIAASVIGSHLYGLAHEESDVDIIVLRTGDFSGTARRKNEHIISGDIDIVVWDLPNYMKALQKSPLNILDFQNSPYLKTNEDNRN